MKEWIRNHRRSALICGITLLVPLLVYLNLLLGVWGVRSEYASGIGRLEPRIARLSGIKAFEAELAESSTLAQQQLVRLVYPPTSDRAGVAASLQSDIKELMTEAGLSVSNSQVLPLREEEHFDYIGVKLTVSGSLQSLDDALARLADFSPVVIIEALDAWPGRQLRSRGESEVQEITASIRLVSLRAVI